MTSLPPHDLRPPPCWSLALGLLLLATITGCPVAEDCDEYCKDASGFGRRVADPDCVAACEARHPHATGEGGAK